MRFFFVVLACSCVCTLSEAATPTLRERLGQGFLAAAHRGGRSKYENTIRQFETARAAGVDIIELDLQTSKDGVVFAIHDHELDDLTNCKGLISETFAAKIKRCRLNGLEHGPQTFEEILVWASDKNVVLNAEFKNIDSVAPVVALVQKYDAFEWTYFQVKVGPQRYEATRKLDARVWVLPQPRGATLQQELAYYAATKDPRILGIELQVNDATRANIKWIHDQGWLISSNAFRWRKERGLWDKAACEEVYSRGMNIAVSDVPVGCVEQRDAANP